MPIHDSKAGYGWLSIGLHWLAAISVVMLWFVGNRMTSADTPVEEAADLLRVHTSVGVSVYLLLMYRIFRRLAVGFPGRSSDQPVALFRVARTVHITLLLSILVMLLTGPMQLWVAGESIAFFEIGEIASPFAANDRAQEFFGSAHTTVARVLAVVFLLHVAGATRQILFSKGETANRMLVATEGKAPGQPRKG